MAGKQCLEKIYSMSLQIPWGVKHFVEIALSCTFSEINAFLRITQNFKMAAKDSGKMIFDKK